MEPHVALLLGGAVINPWQRSPCDECAVLITTPTVSSLKFQPRFISRQPYGLRSPAQILQTIEKTHLVQMQFENKSDKKAMKPLSGDGEWAVGWYTNPGNVPNSILFPAHT
jgi:hypothetical protein